MKSLHTFIIAAVALVLAPTSAMAADDTVKTDASGCVSVVYEAENLGYGDFVSIFRVSCNGKYAVASTGIIDDGASPYIGVLWTADDGEMTVFNADNYGQESKGVIFCDVSNDGMIVGAHPVLGLNSAGTGFEYRWKPAYYKDGAWTNLPLPDKYAIATSEASDGLDIAYASVAKRVTPDGNTIAGEIYIADDNIRFSDNSLNSVKRFEPVIWTHNDSGDWDIQTFYQDTQEDGIYGNQGFVVYDISHDGTKVVGSCTSLRGDWLPAIADAETGKVSWHVGPELTYLSSENRFVELDREGNQCEEWWDGMINCIDANNNIYYYYNDGDGNYYSLSENLDTGDKEYYDNTVACGNGDLVIGLNKILKGDKTIDLADIYTVINMSDDGMVLAGGGYDSYDYGYEFNYPMLIQRVPADQTTGINSVETAPGEDKIYTITGVRLNQPQKGINIINGRKVIVK
ncbi:MAG: hypothetical protein LUC22_03170 [Prevotella sp.]|nr:hypothetical protein [Prevotella sp.]